MTRQRGRLSSSAPSGSRPLDAKQDALFAALRYDDCSDDGERMRSLEVDVPLVLREGPERHIANGAWRSAFGVRMPQWGRAAMNIVGTSEMQLNVLVDRGTSSRSRMQLIDVLPVYGARRKLAVAVRCSGAEGDRGPLPVGPLLVWGGSARTCRIASYANASMRGLARTRSSFDWTSIVHRDDVPAVLLALAEARERAPSSSLTIRLRGADNRFSRHNLKCLVLRGGSRWILAGALDAEWTEVREREQTDRQVQHARAAAAKATRIKDQVIAIVSHELRAPVMTMLLWERLLRDPACENDRRKQALDAIHQSAMLQSRMVGDLLDMSRAASGKLHVNLRPIDVGALVVDSVQASLPLAKARQITLTEHGSEAAGLISGDVARLRQALDNLLSNAIKFTGPGGTVRVTCVRRRGSLTIEVKDTGRGIDRELLERIFTPFSQGFDPLPRYEGGLGLGLAIAKQLVELHRGTLTASSDGRDRGATMTIVLPTRRRLRQPTARVAPIGALQGARVLVVDDDEHVRSGLGFLLARTGAIVSHADSAAAARERVRLERPDIMICDIGMPGENGYDFVRSLRTDGYRFPSIAVTAFAAPSDAATAIAAGFHLHVATPVDLARLVANLGQILSQLRTGKK